MTDVIAYDIDGVLTRDEILNQYKADHQKGKIVGIVSSRPERGRKQFIASLSPAPDFTNRTRVKVAELAKIRMEYSDADSYTYVGNEVRDAVAASSALWKFRRV